LYFLSGRTFFPAAEFSGKIGRTILPGVGNTAFYEEIAVTVDASAAPSPHPLPQQYIGTMRRSDLKSFMGHIGTPDFSSLVDYVSMMNNMHILHSIQNVE
jgi:hypothetical protein